MTEETNVLEKEELKELGKTELINSIVALVEKQDKDVVIQKLLAKFDQIELKEILQRLVDPMYETKQEVYTKAERFTKVGKLDLK